MLCVIAQAVGEISLDIWLDCLQAHAIMHCLLAQSQKISSHFVQSVIAEAEGTNRGMSQKHIHREIQWLSMTL